MRSYSRPAVAAPHLLAVMHPLADGLQRDDIAAGAAAVVAVLASLADGWQDLFNVHGEHLSGRKQDETKCGAGCQGE